MGKDFNLLDILGNDKKTKRKQKSFVIEYVDIDLIEPSKNNFYSVNDVEELKGSIQLYGLQQNLVLRKKVDNDMYELISGERRLTALKALVAEGHEEFKSVPSKVEYEIDDVKAELLLILTNSTARTLSDYEKIQQATKLKSLLQELKKRGIKLPGRLRDIVAETLDISPSQVGRMDSINNNLSDEFKEELKENNINISTAAELATLPEEKQAEVYQEYKEKGNLEIKDVKQAKEAAKEQDVNNISKEAMEGQTCINEPTCEVKTEAAAKLIEDNLEFKCKANITYDFVVRAKSKEDAETTAFEALADDVTRGIIRTDIFNSSNDYLSIPMLIGVDVVPVESIKKGENDNVHK